MSHISVSIESPVKYYDFTDQHGDVLATLRFVPSDVDIFSRYDIVHEAFEKMQEELTSIINSGEPEEKDVVSLKDKYAAEMKEKFDYLFNADTSGLFGIASPFTPLESGKPWALVILESVTQIIQKETGKNLKAMKNNASKYTEKYHAAPGKYPFPVK